jgi:flagellar basal-body rod modification protein FlgD
MPQIGRPQSPQDERYSQVTMAPRAATGSAQQLNADEKQKLFDKISNYKPESNYKNIKDHNKMGKDEFLKLLTYQMQNQDPMNPMDQTKFTAELAQFSQLEQLTNLNSKFDQMQKSSEMKDQFYAASFIGKKVVTSGATVKLKDDGGEADVLFKLSGEAKQVMVRLFDSKGNMIAQINKENLFPGNHQVKWDGIGFDGAPVKAGDYSVQILAYDQSLQRVASETSATGLVESVTFEDGEATLMVDGKKVFLRDVKSFHIADNDKMLDNVRNAQNVAQRMPTATPVKQALQKFEQQQQPMQRSVYDE